MSDADVSASESEDFEASQSADYESTTSHSDLEPSTPAAAPGAPIRALRAMSDDSTSTDEEFEEDMTSLQPGQPRTFKLDSDLSSQIAAFLPALQTLIERIPPEQTLAQAVSASAADAERSAALIDAGTRLLFMGFYNVFTVDVQHLVTKLADKRAESSFK